MNFPLFLKRRTYTRFKNRVPCEEKSASSLALFDCENCCRNLRIRFAPAKIKTKFCMASNGFVMTNPKTKVFPARKFPITSYIKIFVNSIFYECRFARLRKIKFKINVKKGEFKIYG